MMRVETPKTREWSEALQDKAVEFHGHGGPFMIIGLRMKFKTVATRPIRVGAPGFLVHHSVSTRRDVPTMSQSMGRWVSCQKMGATSQFNTAQSEDDRAMAAMFRVLK